MNQTTTIHQPQQLLDRAELIAQNRRFRGSGGRSQENRGQGFRPAFLDTLDGSIHLSRFADGRIAPMHLLNGLPGELIRQHSESGRVIAGFERDGRFYTRAQAAAASVLQRVSN